MTSKITKFVEGPLTRCCTVPTETGLLILWFFFCLYFLLFYAAADKKSVCKMFELKHLIYWNPTTQQIRDSGSGRSLSGYLFLQSLSGFRLHSQVRSICLRLC
jgi:hypothetical protein